MNEHAVEALREAMEAPSWWTNRARLSAREVLERLEAQGYQVAPIEGSSAARPGEPDLRAAEEAAAREAAATAAASATDEADPPRSSLSRFMGDLDARVTSARRDAEAATESENEGHQQSA
jgi:hypothetical protein